MSNSSQTASTVMLYDYMSGVPLRPATDTELAESIKAAESDGGLGAIEVAIEGIVTVCYAQ